MARSKVRDASLLQFYEKNKPLSIIRNCDSRFQWYNYDFFLLLFWNIYMSKNISRIIYQEGIFKAKNCTFVK